MNERAQTTDDATPSVGTGTNRIEVHRVSYWYGNVLGVNDISLKIGSGVIGLLGPNGAGKSTLFKIMSGQLKPATGTAKIDGEQIWNNAQLNARIGLVPEHDAFYEQMTGLEFVTYLTRLQGFDESAARRRARKQLETVELTEAQSRPIATYSRGMRQRTKLAQALAHDPEILFLDEPLTGTDPVGRRTMIDLVRRAGEAGKTILLSSHVLHEIEQMTDTILLIHKGRLLADGRIGQIRRLIDKHPHRIEVDTNRPRAFASEMIACQSVHSVEVDVDRFALSTEAPGETYPRILETALEHDFEIESLISPDNNLASVFDYLTEN